MTDSPRTLRPLLHRRPVRFVAVLAGFFLLMATPAVARLLQFGELVTGVVVTVVFAAVLEALVFAVSAQRAYLLLARVLMIATVGLFSADLFLASAPLLVAKYVVGLVFVGLTSLLILKKVFSAREADSETICAALCVFFMFGLLWAMAYSLMAFVDPGAAFRGPDGPIDLAFGGTHSFASLYFSFVTLTTLGYGDFIPLSEPARVLAITEAIVGQLFLVVLVARLVGLNVARGVSAGPQLPPDPPKPADG